MGSGIVEEGAQPIGSSRDFLDQHPLSSLLRSDDGTHVCIELEMEVGFLEGQVKFTQPNWVSVWWYLRIPGGSRLGGSTAEPRSGVNF